jgi:hypothetical protein
MFEKGFKAMAHGLAFSGSGKFYASLLSWSDKESEFRVTLNMITLFKISSSNSGVRM